MELTLAKMAFVLLMVWLIAWTPYALMTCWILFFDLRLLTANVALVPTLCCKLSAAVNSLMYGSRYKLTNLLPKGQTVGAPRNGKIEIRYVSQYVRLNTT